MRFRKLVGAAVLVVVGVCGPVAVANAAPLPVASATAPGARPAVTPACTRHVTQPAELDLAQPGDTVCVDITSAAPITLRKGGLPDNPVTYVQTGGHVGGVVVAAPHIVVQQFRLTAPVSPGIDVRASDVNVENNTVTSPEGGDGTAIRFAGDDVLVSRNTVSNTAGSRADCVQGTGSDITVSGNRCEQVDGNCLNASSGGGDARNWTVVGNYCQSRRSPQTVLVDDVQNVTIAGNTWAAGPAHAITLRNHTSHVTIGRNAVDPTITCEVAIDATSHDSYTGPPSRCAA